MQVVIFFILKIFFEEYFFGGKYNVYDSQLEFFVVEIEKLKLEMEYIKFLMKKVLLEIEILELKKKYLLVNCIVFFLFEKQQFRFCLKKGICIFF